MYVAIRDCMLPAMGLEDHFDALEALGLDSVELAVSGEARVSWPTSDGGQFDLTLADDRVRLKELFDAKGASICAFLMGNDFTSEEFDAEVRALVTTCEAAEAVCVPAVRVDMVLRRADMPEDEFVGCCAEAVRKALSATSSVRIGVENHGSTSNRPELLDKVFAAVGDMRFGLTLDSGNFYWYGHPLDTVYQIMERYADRTYHAHIKNIAYPEQMRNVQREVGYRYGEYVSPIYEGDIDHGRVVEILRQGGYEGDLSIEDESLGRFPKEQHAGILKRDADHLRSLL